MARSSFLRTGPRRPSSSSGTGRAETPSSRRYGDGAASAPAARSFSATAGGSLGPPAATLLPSAPSRKLATLAAPAGGDGQAPQARHLGQLHHAHHAPVVRRLVGLHDHLR